MRYVPKTMIPQENQDAQYNENNDSSNNEKEKDIKNDDEEEITFNRLIEELNKIVINHSYISIIT